MSITVWKPRFFGPGIAVGVEILEEIRVCTGGMLSPVEFKRQQKTRTEGV